MMNTFSDQIGRMEARRPGNFPAFRGDQPIHIFSDYAGAHAESRFDAYSFLITQPGGYGNWERDRVQIRDAFGLEKRRMAYKGLGDQVKARALMPWLTVFDDLPGLLVTILVDKSLGSLFPARAADDLKRVLPEYGVLKKKTIERTFRVCHFLSVFVAGLSSAGQNIMWISDQDEIAANEGRLRLFTNTLGRVCSMYLTHELGHLRIGTTASDSGNLQLEDMTSLPDLVAGTLSELHTMQLANDAMPETKMLTPIPESLSIKSQQLITWLTLRDLALKRMVFVFWPAPGDKIYSNKVAFHFSDGPRAKRPL